MAATVRGGFDTVNWRRLGARLHLWGGLITGPLVLFLGLSGAALVFRTQIEAVEFSPPVVTSARMAAPSLDAIVAAAQTRHPGAEPRALLVPDGPRQPYRVELLAARQHVVVAIDPATLQVIGERAAERSLMVAVLSLHGALHSGRPGTVVVGLLGLWLVVESVTGLWLGWPSMRPRARAIRAGPGDGDVSRRVHRVVGGLSLAVGVIVALTGVALAFAGLVTLAGAIGASERDGGALGRFFGLGQLDLIAERAETALPGARITALVADASHAVRVETTAGPVIFDRQTGRFARTPADRAGLTAWDWVRRLHSGDFLGWASRIVYALVGLALPILSITGYLITARRAGGPQNW